MPDVAKRLVGPTQLGTAAATVYTVPASTQTFLRSIYATNISASAWSGLTLSIGANSGTTQLFSNYAIPAQGVLEWTGFIVLNAGEILQALASNATSLNLIISGIEAT